MRTKAIADLGGKAARCLLAMALALLGLVVATPEKAHADEATIYVSDEHLDFTQYDSNTGNSWADTFMYINGEVVMCIDITETVVDGASYWAEGMDADMAMRIGLYDRYLWEAYPGWGRATHYGYLQYMIWCEYTPGYMDAYVTPGPSDFWDVYGAAKSYYESNRDNFEAWGTEWHSSSSQNVCVIARLVELGSVELTKTSGSTKLTDGNGCYSLEGAVYRIYSDSACTSLVDSMTTDADGHARADRVTSGDYWVKEISPSPGYALDGSAYPVTVSAGQTAAVNGGSVVEVPKSDPVGMLVAKVDADLGAQPQGAASLEGAEFTVAFYKGQYATAADAEASGAADRTWTFRTDADGFCTSPRSTRRAGPISTTSRTARPRRCRSAPRSSRRPRRRKATCSTTAQETPPRSSASRSPTTGRSARASTRSTSPRRPRASCAAASTSARSTPRPETSRRATQPSQARYST